MYWICLWCILIKILHCDGFPVKENSWSIFIIGCLQANSNNSSPFRLRFSPPSVGLKVTRIILRPLSALSLDEGWDHTTFDQMSWKQGGITCRENKTKIIYILLWKSIYFFNRIMRFCKIPEYTTNNRHMWYRTGSFSNLPACSWIFVLF